MREIKLNHPILTIDDPDDGPLTYDLLRLREYDYLDRLAVQLTDSHPDREANVIDLSTNVGMTMDPDSFFFDVNGFTAPKAKQPLVDAGIIEQVIGVYAKSGFVTYPCYRLTEKALGMI